MPDPKIKLSRKEKRAERKLLRRKAVESVYQSAQETADKRYQADSQKAQQQDTAMRKSSSEFEGGRGRLTQKDFAASGAYSGSFKSYNEQGKVEGMKKTGYYDAKPQVSGGSKKLVRLSRKNVRNNAASKAAKKSALRLY